VNSLLRHRLVLAGQKAFWEFDRNLGRRLGNPLNIAPGLEDGSCGYRSRTIPMSQERIRGWRWWSFTWRKACYLETRVHSVSVKHVRALSRAVYSNRLRITRLSHTAIQSHECLVWLYSTTDDRPCRTGGSLHLYSLAMRL